MGFNQRTAVPKLSRLRLGFKSRFGRSFFRQSEVKIRFSAEWGLGTCIRLRLFCLIRPSNRRAE